MVVTKEKSFFVYGQKEIDYLLYRHSNVFLISIFKTMFYFISKRTTKELNSFAD
ncbi:hypothetical protein DEAC_c35130 [Desulfosporosinus acididurans]|uniref:Uncharacterized protein n=1 Tax=Desulfosporosinus acididurans TaxID=476652 RepID=A0A0J1FMK6_9FIRM|nr:hypothetical protein DEAC_c35130 [Desulfosporosinus acididurans]